MTDINEINQQIETLDTLLSKASGVGKFPSQLERKFQRDYFKRYHKAARLTLWLGFFLFALGSLFILGFFPNWEFPFSVSILMTSPVLLILLFLCYTKIYFGFQQTIVMLFAITILMGLAVIAAVAPMSCKDLVYQGMILPPLFVSTLANLQFRFSIFIMIVVMLASNISYHFSQFYELHNYYSLLVNNYLLFGGSSLCLIASYFNERQHRTQFLLAQTIQVKNNLLEYLSNYDEVTHVANRRYFNKTLEKEWRKAVRECKPLGIIFLDFDFFKEFNDLYGHPRGDYALKRISHALLSCARKPEDFVARYGGDEFIIILPNTTLESGVEVAKKIQFAIKNLKIQHGNSTVSEFITTTIGVASIRPRQDTRPVLLLKHADIALTDGKKIERNAIYTYKDSECYSNTLSDVTPNL